MNARPKQADITRAVKAALAAGIVVGRIEVTSDGKIIIVPADPAATAEFNFRL